MRQNKWFEEVFLPSMKNGQWLTRKQLVICAKYMEEDRDLPHYYIYTNNKHYMVYEHNQGEYGRIYIQDVPSMDDYLKDLQIRREKYEMASGERRK